MAKPRCSQARHMAGCNHRKISANALKTRAWHRETTAQTTHLFLTHCILVNCCINMESDTIISGSVGFSNALPAADMNHFPDYELLFCACFVKMFQLRRCFISSCFCKTNSRISSRLAWSVVDLLWPHVVFQPASGETVCLCFIHASQTLPPSQIHLAPEAWTNTYIHPADTCIGVILSWHGGCNQCHLALWGAYPTAPPNEAFKMKCSSQPHGFSCLLFSHYAAPIILSSRGSGPKQTLNLSCFVISSVATEPLTNTCSPHIDFMSAAAWWCRNVLHLFCLKKEKKNKLMGHLIEICVFHWQDLI